MVSVVTGVQHVVAALHKLHDHASRPVKERWKACIQHVCDEQANKVGLFMGRIVPVRGSLFYL